MAKAAAKKDPKPKVAQPETSIAQTAGDAPGPVERAGAGKTDGRTEVRANDAGAVTSYTNYCRVTTRPEELIIDFGIDKNPIGQPTVSVDIVQQVILNYFTAKRLLTVLQAAVGRHEAAFGALETNVQKRLLPSALRQASS